jgi:hypothetical protein
LLASHISISARVTCFVFIWRLCLRWCECSAAVPPQPVLGPSPAPPQTRITLLFPVAPSSSELENWYVATPSHQQRAFCDCHVTVTLLSCRHLAIGSSVTQRRTLVVMMVARADAGSAAMFAAGVAAESMVLHCSDSRRIFDGAMYQCTSRFLPLLCSLTSSSCNLS